MLMVGQREILSSHVLVSLRQFIMFFHCFSCKCVNIWFCLTLMLKTVVFVQCAVFCSKMRVVK